MNRYVLTIALAIAALCVASTSHASETLLYARKGALLQMNTKGPRRTKRVVTLPNKARIVVIRASRNGVVLLRDDKGKWYWVDSNAAKPKRVRRTKHAKRAKRAKHAKRAKPRHAKPVASALPCTGAATLSPDGRLVVCNSKTTSPRGISIHHLATSGTSTLAMVTSQVGFKNQLGGELVVALAGKLWAAPLATPDARRLLAPHAPVQGLLIAPDGRRGVGQYSDGTRKRIFTFRLDGRAAKRRLVRDAVPVAWSADSKWVLTQSKNEACVVRSTGGQFKCWRKFRALAISRDGTTAILGRRKRKHVNLYKAQLNGASSSKPTLFIRNANMTAAWR